jgi:chorismate mutase
MSPTITAAASPAPTGSAARPTTATDSASRTASPTAGTAAAAGTTVAGTTPSDTDARTDDAAAGIDSARARIDDLDERIIALVRDRMALSAAVQEARIASGGRRVHLSREMQILTRYRERLGKPGTSLAMTLLELCRGRA